MDTEKNHDRSAKQGVLKNPNKEPVHCQAIGGPEFGQWA